MRFPEYFGHNLDALHDSLTDLSWLRPVRWCWWDGSNVLRRTDPSGYRRYSRCSGRRSSP
ncbi:barstar family protein [Pseudonocardia acidicola]|uniref:Barstar family protein n=1 Tax=Pseudonocardia acidicola TaxID=2724939 RepID=A0ABX1S7Y8_9PSEU|nr:barstar family protein [Pseudonocardia acidicola]NMH96702.1 barstar family protein [Pseudonocardia acidicola]